MDPMRSERMGGRGDFVRALGSLWECVKVLRSCLGWRESQAIFPWPDEEMQPAPHLLDVPSRREKQ